MWPPPVISWFRFAPVTSSLFAYHKPEWNWSYVHQLNAIERGPHIVYIYISIYMEVFMGNHRYHMDPYSGAESREWGKWSMKIIPFLHSLPSTGKDFFLTIVVDSALANLKYWSWVEHIVCNTGWWLSPTPLKNMSSSVGVTIPNDMESHKIPWFQSPPTRIVYLNHLDGHS